MKLSFQWRFTLVTVVAVCGVCAPVALAEKLPASEASLLDRLHSIFGVKAIDGNALEAMPGLLEALAAEPAKAIAIADQLVRDLEAGRSPASVSTEALSNAHVWHRTIPFPSDWKNGDLVEIIAVLDFLLARSEVIDDTDTENSASFARAAALLAAKMEPFVGDTLLHRVVRDVDAFVAQAGLRGEQAEAFRKFVAQLKESNQGYGRILFDLDVQQSQILAGDGAGLDPEQLDRVLAQITRARGAVNGQSQRAHELANYTWELKNIAQHRKDNDSAQRIIQYITQWREGATQEHVRRWLSEALERDGPTPKPRYIHRE